MKKLFALLLALMMVFALAACGNNNTTDPDKDNPGVSQSGEDNDAPVEAGELLTIKLGVSIPKPDIEYTVALDAVDCFKIDWNWETITTDQVKHYAKRMEAAGFTCTDENDNKEMDYYSWKGEKDNVIVEIDDDKVWIELK